jgi:hypothetical protein
MNPQEFDEIFSRYERIKHEHADEQLEFYTKRVLSKRRVAQWSGAAVLVISLAIPIVTNLGIDISQHSLNMIIGCRVEHRRAQRGWELPADSLWRA